MVSLIRSSFSFNRLQLVISEDVIWIHGTFALRILHITVPDLRLSLTLLPFDVVIIALTWAIASGLLQRRRSSLIDRLRLPV